MSRWFVRSTVLLGLVLAACGGDSSTGPSASSAIALTPGVAMTNLSGSSNSRTLYRITVPAGTTILTVDTHSGSGDVDVLVRRGRVPSLVGPTDCDSFNDGNDDGCSVSNPAAGDYYILLFGSGDNGYTGVTLIASFTAHT